MFLELIWIDFMLGGDVIYIYIYLFIYQFIFIIYIYIYYREVGGFAQAKTETLPSKRLILLVGHVFGTPNNISHSVCFVSNIASQQ